MIFFLSLWETDDFSLSLWERVGVRVAYSPEPQYTTGMRLIPLMKLDRNRSGVPFSSIRG